MASTQENRSDYIDQVRRAADDLLCAAEKLNALRKSWDYGMSSWIVDASGNDPTDPDYQPGDFVHATGLMKADIAAVVGTTLDALSALLAAGHGTNLEKIRK